MPGDLHGAVSMMLTKRTFLAALVALTMAFTAGIATAREKIDVVAVSETDLCPEECHRDHACARVSNLNGWTWIGKARNNHGGGVGFLLRNTVAFKVRQDLADRNVEQIWIEIYRDRASSVLACSVYIPPGKIQQLSRFADIVVKARGLR